GGAGRALELGQREPRAVVLLLVEELVERLLRLGLLPGGDLRAAEAVERGHATGDGRERRGERGDRALRVVGGERGPAAVERQVRIASPDRHERLGRVGRLAVEEDAQRLRLFHLGADLALPLRLTQERLGLRLVLLLLQPLLDRAGEVGLRRQAEEV